MLVDQYDALRSTRPYKKGFSHEDTYEIITVGDGRTMPVHFDPSMFDLFLRIHKEFENIFDKNI
ncbi:hypothetical protein BMS3Bbin07_01005 [bacterium BMS3Bbin07]|nr:hypothetical protein BMS3Bbin07_01005 [bacterium BMS3Bbin07]